MVNRSNARSRLIVVASLVLPALLAACGPSAEEKARRASAAEARAAAAQALADRREAMMSRAEERSRTGDQGPPRVYDPGYRVARCGGRTITDDVGYIKAPSLIGDSEAAPSAAVCENTKAGRAIIAWRDWFCEGDRVCVLSYWAEATRKGEPVFIPLMTSIIDISMTIRGAGATYRFSPARWPNN